MQHGAFIVHAELLHCALTSACPVNKEQYGWGCTQNKLCHQPLTAHIFKMYACPGRSKATEAPPEGLPPEPHGSCSCSWGWG
jgi:hypothetical protein